MKKCFQVFVGVGILSLIVTGCGSSSSTTGGTDDSVALSELSDLPRGTAPVVADTSSSLASLAPNFEISLGEDTTLSNFNGSSYGACEMINRARGGLFQAGSGDQVLCFMQNMITEETGIDLYDGEYHAVDIDMSGAEGSAPDHVKFKVVKNDAGAITQFELFGCTSGSQTYYLSQTISDSSFSMTNKGSSDTGDSSSVTYSASVTGTLNSSGNFTGSKTIDLAYVNDFGGGEGNFCDMTFTQTDVDLTYDGYCRNTGDSTAAEEMFAVVDLVDNDSAVLADWGIGAGAVKIVSDNNTSGEEVTQGWDENGAVDAESAHLADLEGHTPPTASDTAPSVDFESEEIYDCGDTAETTITATADTIMAACADFDLPQTHLECQDVTVIE